MNKKSIIKTAAFKSLMPYKAELKAVDAFLCTISDALKDVDFNAKSQTVNIGQDGTGQYRVNLGAELDEFILLDGVLTDKDVAALKGVYLGR